MKSPLPPLSLIFRTAPALRQTLCAIFLFGSYALSAVTIPDLPEPLKANYETGSSPSVKAGLEARMAGVRSTALWISPTGAPGASGTESDPMNLAEGSASASTRKGTSILFHPGHYDARGFSTIIDYSRGLSSASDFVIGAPDGPAIFNAGHTVSTAEMTDQGNGTWTFSFDPSVNNTPADNRLMIVPVNGDGRSYFSRKASAAEVTNGDGSYYFNVAGETVTVNFAGSAEDLVISCSQDFATFETVAATIGMYGLTMNHFRGGGPHLTNANFSGFDVHVNFAWDFGFRTDGWNFTGSTQAILEACSGNNAQNDGFNQKGTNTYIRLVDCNAIGNNDDGFSPHNDTEHWEVWGGLYQNNGKGNITPAGGRGFVIAATLDTVLGRMDGYNNGGSFRGLALNASTTQVTWMKDCLIRSSGTGSRAVYNEDPTSHVRLDNCRIEDADTGLHSVSGGGILAVNPKFAGNSLDYDSANPNIEVITTVAAYPVPPGERLNTQFTVTADGIPVPVVDEVRTYCHFSFSGEVEIEVTGLSDHTLSPIDYGIVPSYDDGSRMVFTLDRPRYLVLHTGETNELVIFADPSEVDPPQTGDLNVIDYTTWTGTLQEALDRVSVDPLYDIVHVGPGTYDLSTNVKLPSNSALYLAGGAKLNFTSGGIQIVNASHVKLYGRGLIEYNENGGNWKDFGIWTSFATHLEISGIISRNSLNWNVLLEDSNTIDVTYFKVLNDRTGTGE